MAEVSEVLEVTFPVTIILSFYVLDKETKQKVQVHKEKTSFPLFQSRHREIDKTVRDILDFAGAKDTAAKKGLGRNIDATFMRSVRRAGCVESFSIKTQRRLEQDLPKLMDPDCIMQGTLIGFILSLCIDCSISVTF